MKLTVEKLGRIEHADIDIRPLTVFIGPNGTNKTWTAYTLYFLLRSSSSTATSMIKFDHRGRNEDDATEWRKILSPLLDALQQDSPPARVETNLHLGATSGGVVVGSVDTMIEADTLRRLLMLPDGNLSGASARCSFMKEELSRRLAGLRIALERPLNRLTANPIYWNRDGSVDASARIEYNGPITENLILEFVMQHVTATLGEVLVLPAERKGLVAASQLLTGPIDRIIASPLVDFVRLLQLAGGMPNAVESEQASALGRLLAKVAGGEIVFLPSEAGKRLVFRTMRGVVLPIAAASAFSRAVAGLSIYLQHFMSADDVLVIDELEMNAHPQAQLALIEFVAALVQYGVRVVLTTHSPYIVDHLNNLMEAARLSPAAQEEIAPKFALGTTRAFIPSEKVAVHAFEEESPTGKVSVRDVLNRESNLIDWSTFGRVSDKVANLYSDILEKSNTRS